MKPSSRPRFVAPLACLLTCLLVRASAATETASCFPRATPESQGISSAALLPLLDEAEQKNFGLHSIMIVRHGQVVAEGWWRPYAATEPHMLFSLSKSFTSTAVGMLQAEGRLSINDPILKYFTEDAPAAPSENLKAMRIRDLLMMSTGQHKEDVDMINVNAADQTGTKQFLAAPVPHKPGTHFYYNSPATFMCSAIVQKVTGQTARDYLTSRLFEPLGIPTPEWDLTPQGINVGASGLHLRTEEIAKFGQLYLQRGEWNGRRLLPTAWIDLATSRQASNGSNPDSDWDQGYGFFFWRCIPGFYRGDGAFGQFCIVMPQYDTVVAITSGTNDMGGVMKMLWARILPELRPVAIPENAEAQAKLTARLCSLTMPVQTGAATSPLAAKISGRKYTFEQNKAQLESATFDIAADGTVTVKTREFGQDLSVICGSGKWIKGTYPLSPGSTEPVAVSGAWTADDTYTMQFCQYRQPFIATFRVKFAGDELTVERRMNVGFGPNEPALLIGKAQ